MKIIKKEKVFSIVVILLSLALFFPAVFMGTMATDAPGSSTIPFYVAIALPVLGVLVGLLTFFEVLPAKILWIPGLLVGAPALWFIGMTFIVAPLISLLPDTFNSKNLYRCSPYESFDILLQADGTFHLEHLWRGTEVKKTLVGAWRENQKITWSAPSPDVDEARRSIDRLGCVNSDGQSLKDRLPSG